MGLVKSAAFLTPLHGTECINIFFDLCGKGRHQKKNCFFFGKTPKGGVGDLAESKISLSEKNEIFLEIVFNREVSPIPKGCYHKNLEFLDIFAKKGGFTQYIGILS